MRNGRNQCSTALQIKVQFAPGSRSPGTRLRPGTSGRGSQVVRHGQRQPGVGGGLEDVADRQDRVVEPLAASRHRPDTVAEDVAEGDRRDEQRQGIRDGVLYEVDHRRREVVDTDPHVAVEDAVPEMQVLVPQRHVQPEGFANTAYRCCHGPGATVPPDPVANLSGKPGRGCRA